ncbi:single-stranded DNA-binding protein [Embleya sp. NBC_00896]|uniref:single-stranded DNA-binding protein n=1 Tax=Embleya sp. NBC_00896 TaxID=2975961 RepID=UPI00386EF33B|nr:single-stranded DNA-binding protein [Embleya sp. NBC_00896]
MSNATPITVVGNVTRDPEIKFTPSGVAVARLSIAATPRKFDKATNKWIDGETTFWACTAWRSLAEHVTESLRKGDRVIASGTVTTQRWTDKDSNEPRERMVLDLDDVGPSLLWADATVTRTGRRNAPAADGPWDNFGTPDAARPQTPTDDNPPF